MTDAPNAPNAPDITLVPETDGTYAVHARPTARDLDRRELVRRRLSRARFGWFLGFDPKSATDRLEVERRIAEHVGADLSVAWG